MGSPKGREPYGDGKPIVVLRRICEKKNGLVSQNDLSKESGKAVHRAKGHVTPRRSNPQFVSEAFKMESVSKLRRYA
jgi:hypothetical protein